MDEELNDTFVKKIFSKFEKIVGSNTDVNKAARDELVKLSTQTKFTQQLINRNLKQLQEAAKTDADTAAFLENYDSVNFGKLEEVRQAILKGEKVSKESSNEALEIFENLQESFAGLNFEGLEATFGDMFGQLREVVNNDKIDRQIRRDFVTDAVSLLKEQTDLSEESQSALGTLEGLLEDGLNFTQDQTEVLNDVIKTFEDNKINDIKQRGTLDELNRKFSSFIINQDEIKQTLEESQFDGETLAELLKDGLDGDTKQGILDFVFAALGLPGFSSFLGGLKGIGGKATAILKKVVSALIGKDSFILKIFNKIGGVFKGPLSRIGKFLKPVTNIFSGITKFFGGLSSSLGPVAKAAGRFGKAIPGIGLAITVIMGAFDAVQGFLNASDLTGKSEEMLTLTDKLLAGFSGFISGLTFGLVDAETIFSTFFAGNFLEKLKGAFTTAKESFVNFMSTIPEKLMSIAKGFIGTIIDLIKGVVNGNFTDVVGDIGSNLLDSGSDFLSSLNPFSDDDDTEQDFINSQSGTNFRDFAPPVGGTANTVQTVEPTTLGDIGPTLRSENQGTDLRNKRPDVVAVPVGDGGGNANIQAPAQRRAAIDDIMLSSINAGLLD